MRISLSAHLSCAVLLALLPGACRNAEPFDARQLVGTWTLERGFIDEQPNKRLNGTVFEFYPDGTMMTNLPLGFDAPVPYAIERGYLLQQGEQTFRYVIESATDTSLHLRTELRGVQFRFELVPQKAGAPSPLDGGVLEAENASENE
jgi:hypothetical protein